MANTDNNFQVGGGYSVDLAAYHDAVITHQIDGIREKVFGKHELSEEEQKELRNFYDSIRKAADEGKEIIINVSNHPSSKWSKEQVDACNGAVILDCAFPNINEKATAYEMDAACYGFADWLTSTVHGVDKAHVHFMVAGEQGAHFRIVGFLKMADFSVIQATSSRNTVVSEDGKTKTVTFNFGILREY